MGALPRIGDLQDRRLVSRVLHRVTGGTVDAHLPRLHDVDPWYFGDDWANCALVRVRQPYRQSEFMFVGEKLSPPGAPLDREPIMNCPDTSLLGLTLSYFVQAVEERSFLMLEGAAVSLDQAMLYRSLLVPLSEDDGQVEALLIAANSRLVRDAEQTTSFARLVWSHRYGIRRQ